MCSCKKDSEIALLHANDKSILHEQRKTMKKVSDLDTEVKEVYKETITNRIIVIVFGAIGILIQIFKG